MHACCTWRTLFHRSWCPLCSIVMKNVYYATCHNNNGGKKERNKGKNKRERGFLLGFDTYLWLTHLQMGEVHSL